MSRVPRRRLPRGRTLGWPGNPDNVLVGTDGRARHGKRHDVARGRTHRVVGFCCGQMPRGDQKHCGFERITATQRIERIPDVVRTARRTDTRVEQGSYRSESARGGHRVPPAL